MEKWDAYTREGNLVNKVLIRGEEIPNGLYHLACEVIVKHIDGSYLCMKRAMSKSYYPGYYEATAGGSALLGEDKYQCIKRELVEETGISCEKFDEIGYKIYDDKKCLFHSFVCTVDCDKDSIILQENETEGYIWMNEDEFISFITSDGMIPFQTERYHDYFVKQGWIEKGD